MSSDRIQNSNQTPSTQYFQGYDANLPLPESAREEKTSKLNYYSDHLPVLMEIPLGDFNFKLITWNILLPNVYSGFGDNETDEESIARAENIAKAILNFIKVQKPDA